MLLDGQIQRYLESLLNISCSRLPIIGSQPYIGSTAIYRNVIQPLVGWIKSSRRLSADGSGLIWPLIYCTHKGIIVFILVDFEKRLVHAILRTIRVSSDFRLPSYEWKEWTSLSKLRLH